MDIAHQLSMALSADLSLFPEVPFLCSEMDEVEVAVHQLRGSFLKKWEPNGVTKLAEDAAFEKFSKVNDRMLAWELRLETLQDEYLYGMFEAELHQLLGWRVGDECDFLQIADNVGFGPGSVVGADSENFHKKVFESTLTATSDRLITLYRTAVSRSPTWALAEKRRFDERGFEIVTGCRLFFAPKYAHIARTCSTQPAVNMSLQKGVDSFILKRLLEWGIHLPTQEGKNKELARRGSVDGSICTIDLTSASDCTANALMKRALPEPLRSRIQETRTSVTEYKNRQITLGMVSMMGNGFTFSLETAIFASVVRAVYKLADLPLRVGGSNSWGVYGDDMCVDPRAYHMCCRLLTLLGYEVNDDKSFHVGSFRESCGGDYWKGYLVRGSYIRHLRTDAEVYSAINRLNRWSARHGVPLTCTVQCLLAMVKGRKPFLVPPSEQDDAGLKVPFEQTRPRVADNYSFLYRKLQVSPRRWHPQYHDDGSLDPSFGVAILGGYLRVPTRCISEVGLPDLERGHVGFCREDPGAPSRMKVVGAQIPWWDYAPRDVFRGVSYSSWKAAVAGNLLNGG